MNFFITGCAGFIGFHLTLKLLKKNNKIKIFGIDNVNEYYDKKLKLDRLKILKKYNNFSFKKLDLLDNNKIYNFVKLKKINYIIHLAAQAGVRYSIDNPKSYIESNIVGFFNLLELSRKLKVKHFLYASTSSVYGDTTEFPIKEEVETNSPLSIYAASKITNELLAFTYSNIFKIPLTGMRFFTVYGPFGRPDMALFKFTKSILNNKKIEVYNYGQHIRDWTYVDDVVNAIIKLLHKKSKKKVPHQIFNIGSDNPTKLLDFLNMLEKILNKKAKIKFVKLQTADVVKTHANINKLKKISGFQPNTNLKNGINNFVRWYKDYYKK